MDEASAKLTPRQRELLGQLKSWQASGMSLRAFAEREGLKVQDLYSARMVLKRKGLLGGSSKPRPRFARVQVEPGSRGLGESLCRVRLANGCCVEISCPANAQAWRVLLSAVAALS